MEKEKNNEDKKEKRADDSGKKEEVCEDFIIEKDGERKEIESCGEIKKDPNEIEKQNKQLKIILFIAAGAIIVFLLGYFIFSSMRNFEYEGIQFERINEKGVTFYHAIFQARMTGNFLINYNIFLRKDPRKTGEDIPFEGNIFLSDLMVLNVNDESGDNFNCNGDGVIAIANFNQIFQASGTTIMTDPNATCDPFRRYVLINIIEGEETKIVERERACYDFYVNDCEILDVTERYLLEALKEIN